MDIVFLIRLNCYSKGFIKKSEVKFLNVIVPMAFVSIFGHIHHVTKYRKEAIGIIAFKHLQ